MPTRVEVIANIDETIRDKTISDKIDNVEDADNRELIVDYIDQEVATKVSADDLGAVAFSNDYNDLENKPDLDAKQDTLESGTNIKTINGNNILGSGNLVISGGTAKTSGSITLNGTFQVLPFDVNACAFTGGKAFLPTTTEIMKTIYVIAVANNIEIRANEAGTNRMFQVFNTFTASVTILTNEMYRFTFIDFGGYWKAEKI
jgi:hypothetical protein